MLRSGAGGLTDGAGFILPAVQVPGTPGMFTFALPAGALPGATYRLSATVLDPACTPAVAGSAGLWKPATGKPPSLWSIHGNTKLEAASPGYFIPKGDFGAWVTEQDFGGPLSTHKHYFRVASSVLGTDGGQWQVSLFPFGPETPLEPEKVGGLVYAENVLCSLGPCQFLVDFAKFIAPAPPLTAQGWYQAAQPGSLVVGALKQLAMSGTGGSAGAGGSAGGVVTQGKAMFSPSAVVNSPPGGGLTTPHNYYFRFIPSKQGSPVGGPSNTVRLHWTAEAGGEPFAVKFPVDCTKNPTDPSCPKPVAKTYEMEIVSYHAFIQPKDAFLGCYVVTETTMIPVGFSWLTYPAGHAFCEPEEEANFLDSIVSWVVDAVNWVSEAYNDLKSEVVDLVGSLVPSPPNPCDKACLAIVLDGLLIAAGIPPSIPNFDQFMDQGLDYLATEAIEQAGVPGPLQELAKEEFKKGMKAGLIEMQKSLADSVGYVPDGVPVKPHPLSELQPPSLVVKITRLAGSASACEGKLNVRTLVTNESAAAQAAFAKMKYGMKYSANTLYEDIRVPLPKLAPGESQMIPLVFKPVLQYNPAWGSQSVYQTYKAAGQGWWELYDGGAAKITADGPACAKFDTVSVAAQGAYP